LIKFNIIT